MVGTRSDATTARRRVGPPTSELSPKYAQPYRVHGTAFARADFQGMAAIVDRKGSDTFS